MTHSLQLEIASVRYTISCDRAAIRLIPASTYRGFPPAAQSPTDTIHITLELDGFPDVAALPRTFSAGGAWWSSHAGGTRRLVIGGAIPPEPPLLVAAWEGVPERVTAFCPPGSVLQEDGQAVIFNPVEYPLDQLLLVYRLAPLGGAMIHSAGLELAGKGLIFPGRSGAGKTTLIRQFVAAGVPSLLNDDRMAARLLGDGYRIFGTPWPGDARIAVNQSAPFCGIFFIVHGPDNRVRELAPRTALEKLMPVTSIPWHDRELLPRVLDTCGDIVERVPVFELQFRPDTGVVDFVDAFAAHHL